MRHLVDGSPCMCPDSVLAGEPSTPANQTASHEKEHRQNDERTKRAEGWRCGRSIWSSKYERILRHLDLQYLETIELVDEMIQSNT